MHSSIKLCLSILLLLPSFALQAQAPVVFGAEDDLLRIGKEVFYLEDSSRSLDIEDILSPEVQASFQQHGKEVFASPVTASAYWFRIELLSERAEELWLEIGDPYSTWHAAFYTPNANGDYDSPIEVGALHPGSHDFFPSNYYCLPLRSEVRDIPAVYYLRVSGKLPKTHLLQVGTYPALIKYHQQHEYILAGFIGLLLAMILYNLFLSFSIKNSLYVYYVIYLSILVIEVPFSLGYPIVEFDWMWEYTYVWRNIDAFFVTLFTDKYLELKRRAPKTRAFLWILTLIMGVVFPVLNLLQVDFIALVKVYQLTGLVYAFALLFSGVYVWVKGMKTARFYVLAWGFTIASIFIHVFTINGALPLNIVTKNAIFIGIALETILFALALGDRFNVLKKEKDDIQRENLLLVREQNEVLEKKVQERTSELQQKQEEIQTQNEELKQIHEELETQRDFLSISNEELEAYKYRISQNIQAAKLIQTAMLPTKQRFADHFADHFVLYEAADIVSGDFYWLERIGDKIVLIEADCTGHGVSGAFTTLIGKAIFDQVLLIEKLIDSAAVLERVHALFQKSLNQAETGNKQGMDLSMAVLTPHMGEWKLEFSGAGQKLYYTTTKGELRVLKSSRKKIGGFRQQQLSFGSEEVILPAGTALYLLSDGYADQNAPNRNKYGSPRLQKLIESLHGKPMEQQQQALKQSLESHKQDSEQRDDITIIGVELKSIG